MKMKNMKNQKRKKKENKTRDGFFKKMFQEIVQETEVKKKEKEKTKGRTTLNPGP